mgnify:CR=1 FL=1
MSGGFGTRSAGILRSQFKLLCRSGARFGQSGISAGHCSAAYLDGELAGPCADDAGDELISVEAAETDATFDHAVPVETAGSDQVALCGAGGLKCFDGIAQAHGAGVGGGVAWPPGWGFGRRRGPHM